MDDPTVADPNFKERNRVMQYLVAELTWVRGHNLKYKEGDDQRGLLLYAEAALVLLVLEHFLMIVLSKPAIGSLQRMVEQAVEQGIILVPDKKKLAKELGKVRGALQHGNYQARARQLGMSVEDYFAVQFAREIESLYQLTDMVVVTTIARLGGAPSSLSWSRIRRHSVASSTASTVTTSARSKWWACRANQCVGSTTCTATEPR